ncbi:MAG TPA: type III-B CRISPR-associated protein Cas10/Cmr2 [Bryobacterales bacterium]|nr:type III-B CRISPR-associated protein Cas10/Cmr2 [Bryobacterales bacterium]
MNVAWGDLANTIWDKFVGPVASLGNNTEAIWDRQTTCFWDIAWVIGEDPGDGSDARWLDRRKNWREHREPDEAGDLCTLMGRYQELSGYARLGGKEKQEVFWRQIRKHKYEHVDGPRSVGDLNLRESERLCAIALIKRLFPLVAKDVLGWWPGGDNLSTINWPSTSYVAAVPWLKKVAENAALESVISDYEDECEKKLKSYKGETETRLFGLPEDDFFKLDGHLLHEDGVAAWCRENGVEDRREKLLSALKRVQKASGGRPSEFYAILKMDGDRIGEKIGETETANKVKDGLAIFTAKVKDYFDPAKGNPADGVLVYAGGDDVLAFLPVNSAIEAAYDLRALYSDAFEKADATDLATFTMSAAIIFTHYKNPLRQVLEEAEHYLDRVAKDGNGRDSLAIAVMKPGGIAFDWVSCWEKTVAPGRRLIEVADRVGGEGAEYSTGLLYNIRERYKPIFAPDDREGGMAEGFSDMIGPVLIAEYKKQPGRAKTPRDEAEAAVEPLVDIGQPLRRADNGTISRLAGYDFDGPLVARFLAVEGRRHGPKPAGSVAEDGA